MDAAGWVMLVALALNDGGFALLYDKATGQPPVFDTRAACEVKLAEVTTQAMSQTEHFILEKSTFKCVPAKAK